MSALTGCNESTSDLPGPSGNGSVKCSPPAVTRRRCRADLTIWMYSRVRPTGSSNRTPCQPSETCGPETPRPNRNLPPDSASRVAAVIAVIAGVRPGICNTAEPLRPRGHRGQHADGIRAVRLRRPHRVVAEVFGGLGECEVSDQFGRRGDVPQIQAKTHTAWHVVGTPCSSGPA